jgi:hypothetical protein
MTITNIMACSNCAVVEYSTHNAKIKSSNPSTDTSTENNAKSAYIIPLMLTKIIASSGSTVVGHLNYNPKIKGSNPSTDTGIKSGKRCCTLLL